MIAIVDDDEGCRIALEKLMRSVGRNASAFGSAEEFLSSEELHNTSCLITDLQMPGLNGIELQDRLVAGGHRIPIIFITAHPDDNVRARAMKAGAIAWFEKPVDPHRLIGCIESGEGRSKQIGHRAIEVPALTANPGSSDDEFAPGHADNHLI
jgi:FixJ family two-component response regulator